MEEINPRILMLIIKRCKCTIIKEEEQELDQWISERSENKAEYDKILETLLDMVIQSTSPSPDLTDLFKRIRERRTGRIIVSERQENVAMYWLIQQDMRGDNEPGKNVNQQNLNKKTIMSSEKQKRTLSKNQWIIILLVISTIIITLFMFDLVNDLLNRPNPILSNEGTLEIEPAKPGAVLVSNGQPLVIEKEIDTSYTRHGTKISHKNGMVFYQKPNDTVATELLQLITPKAGIYSVELSDGSKVWLNAGSTLKFPSRFDEGFTREVTLYGEGYFEINTEKHTPFVVVLPSGENLEVKSSPFNINTYDDQKQRELIVTGGKFKVSSPRYPEGTDFDKIDLSTKSSQHCKITIFAWRNGKFSFCNKPFNEVMNELGRWYNVEIEFSNKYRKQERLFSGEFSRTITLNKLIVLLEKTEIAKFSLTGRNLTVLPFKK